MKIAKWGNSLAVRIPRDVQHALDLREGDEIELKRTTDRDVEICRADRLKDTRDAIRKFRWNLPPNYKFDREEANAR